MQIPVTTDFWSGMTEILRSVTPYGVLGIVALLIRLDRRMTVMRVILTGEKGDNGIKGELGTLRKRVHEIATTVQAVETEVAVHDQRLKTGGL